MPDNPNRGQDNDPYSYWPLVVTTLGAVAGFIGVGYSFAMNLIRERLDHPQLFYSSTNLLTLVITFLGTMVPAILALTFRRIRLNEKKQEEKVSQAEAKASQDVEFQEFLSDQITLLAERSRTVMTRADGRASWLNTLGTFLAVFSVFAPLVSFAIYYASTPIDDVTLPILDKLKSTQGDFPDGISVSLHKDWHILLSGISFGFLFLAAAGAIFAQHRREVEFYHSVAEEVTFLDSVVAAVRIQRASDQAVLTPGMFTLLSNLLSELLKRRTNRSSSAPIQAESQSSGETPRHSSALPTTIDTIAARLLARE